MGVSGLMNNLKTTHRLRNKTDSPFKQPFNIDFVKGLQKKIIGIDGPGFIWTMAKSSGRCMGTTQEQLVEGVRKRFIQLIDQLKLLGCQTLIVFDGPNYPRQKDSTKKERREKIEKSSKKYDEVNALYKENTKSVSKMDCTNLTKMAEKQQERTNLLRTLETLEKAKRAVSKQDMDDIALACSKQGAIVVQGDGEAEATLASYNDIFGAVMTSDSDFGVFGGAIQINKYVSAVRDNERGGYKFPDVIDWPSILKGCGISLTDLRQISSLMKNDFNSETKIKKVGFVSAHDNIVIHFKHEESPLRSYLKELRRNNRATERQTKAVMLIEGIFTNPSRLVSQMPSFPEEETLQTRERLIQLFYGDEYCYEQQPFELNYWQSPSLVDLFTEEDDEPKSKRQKTEEPRTKEDIDDMDEREKTREIEEEELRPQEDIADMYTIETLPDGLDGFFPEGCGSDYYSL